MIFFFLRIFGATKISPIKEKYVSFKHASHHSIKLKYHKLVGMIHAPKKRSPAKYFLLFGILLSEINTGAIRKNARNSPHISRIKNGILRSSPEIRIIKNGFLITLLILFMIF